MRQGEDLHLPQVSRFSYLPSLFSFSQSLQ